MSGYLIDSATVLSGDDAGGHGGHWGVIDDPAALFKQWLSPMVQEGQMANLGLDEAVKPRCVTLYGIPFWRLGVTLLWRDSDFALPFYVAEGLFESGWRPTVGESWKGRYG